MIHYIIVALMLAGQFTFFGVAGMSIQRCDFHSKAGNLKLLHDAKVEANIAIIFGIVCMVVSTYMLIIGS